MIPRFIVDKILHAFISDGNLHVVFGVSTGLLNDQGDIKEPQVTIVIPAPCANQISDELSEAISHFNINIIDSSELPAQDEGLKTEILGPSIELKIT